MKFTFFKIFSLIVTTLVVTMFFSCESNFKNVSKIYLKEFIPINEAEGIHLKYTDSGKVNAILKGKRMLDFSNTKFPYTEFPEGIHLIAFDENGKTTNIYSSYAISYSGTKIIELRNKVKIVTSDYKILETEKLYYNRNEEWFFTDEKCKFYTNTGNESYFAGFDCSKDFKIVNAHALIGSANLNE